MKSRLNWNDLYYFLHVAKTHNLTQSALALGVSQSTIARRISSLEQQLKLTLFTRHQTGYFLTEQANQLFDYAQAIEAKIMGFTYTATTLQTEVAGKVRLATAENIATQIIIPALPKLYQTYPNLQLEIVTGINTVGFLQHEVDIALRVVRPEQGNLLIRRVGKIAYSLYAHTAYLAHFTPPYAADLNRYHYITWDNSYAHLPSALWLAKHLPERQVIVSTTSVATQFAAVQAGLGVAVLPNLLAETDQALISLMDTIFYDDLWMVSYPELRSSTTIRAVIDFVVATLAKSPFIIAR